MTNAAIQITIAFHAARIVTNIAYAGHHWVCYGVGHHAAALLRHYHQHLVHAFGGRGLWLCLETTPL